MIKNIKSVLKASLVALSGLLALHSCESEADNLGSQLFEGTMADGTVKSYPVMAYNVSHSDTIRTDAAKLTSAVLGAFSDPSFGMQKSSYVTQVRLSSYAPTFGTNPVVDSVVMVIKPTYAKDSITTATDENYMYQNTIAAKQVLNTYPITKYGKAKAAMTINVHEVKDFLGSPTDMVFSNKSVATGALLGTKTLNGKVSSVAITKDADNSSLLSRDAGIRIPLDKTFFQNKIIAKGGSSELSDVSNFIRYFNGVRVSVAENDGYMMNFAPNSVEMVMYYKNDVTANGTTTATPATFTFVLGSGNVHLSQIENNRANSGLSSEGYDSVNGNKRLYPQGMGGPGFGVRIPAKTVEDIRTLFKNQGVGIISAKIRLYTDTSVWNNGYAKPASFTVEEKGSTTFLSDLSAMNGNAMYNLIKAYDLAKNPAYYDISITQTFKNIIEKAAENKDFIVNVGNYESNSTTGAIIAPAYNTRAYTPNRTVLVGTDAGNANAAQLQVIYSKK